MFDKDGQEGSMFMRDVRYALERRHTKMHVSVTTVGTRSASQGLCGSLPSATPKFISPLDDLNVRYSN